MNAKQRSLSLFLVGGGLLAGALAFAPHQRPVPTKTPPPVAQAPVPQPLPDPVAPVAPPALTQPQGEQPLIQIALLLDNSGSMSGLLEQAKSQLWHLVNQLAEAKRGGQRPRLELALYEYGDRPMRLVDFTNELDRVSEALFGLTIRGGDEWCGRTIQDALEHLAWSKDPKAMKMIFIAGNEPFNQGDLDPTIAVRRANEQGVIVNTIYCGDGRSSEAGGWRQGAYLADGRFLSIDHNVQVVEVEAPQDQELAQLGIKLNETYIPYGTEGAAGNARQGAQDSNSSGYGFANLSRRAVSKASSLYQNPTWELVDALSDHRVDLDQIQEEALPEAMRGLSAAERQAYVAQKAQDRRVLQAKIQRLNQEREAFVTAERNKQSGTNSLDVAMVEAVKGQAQKHGFEFGR